MKDFLRKPLVILLLFGIIYRLLLVYFYRHISIFPDSEGYQTMAKMIADFDFSRYEGQRTPGYPLLLSLLNNNLILLIGAQLIIGLANSVLIFQNLKLLKFKPKHALLIALCLDSLLHVVFYEMTVLTESVTVFLISCIANILLRGYFDRKSVKQEFLLGFALALLILVKPFYIFLPFLVYGFSLLKDFGWKTLFGSRLLVFIFPLTAFFGWSYVNKVHTGYFVPSTFYGYNIAQNCVYFAEKAPKQYAQVSSIYVHHREETLRKKGDVSMSIWYAYNDLQKATGLSFADLSFELNQFSWATIKKNPIDYLKQVKTSWYDFWRTVIYWNEGQFKVKTAAPVFIGIWEIQHLVLRLFKVLFIFSLPIVLFQFMKTRRISAEIILSAIIFAASLLQAFSTYGTNSRFSYPFESLMVILVLLQLKQFRKTNKNTKQQA